MVMRSTGNGDQTDDSDDTVDIKTQMVSAISNASVRQTKPLHTDSQPDTDENDPSR